jgi:hypothetical protein
MRQLSIAALIIVLVTLPGCRKKQSDTTSSLDDTTIAAPTPLPEPAAPPPAPEFTFDRRQEFVQSIHRQLGHLDQEIGQLASQVKSRGGAVSDRAVANIRAARRTVDRNLRRVEAATAANWEQVRNTVNQSVDRLSESIEAAQPK